MDGVNFINIDVIDVTDKCLEEEMEVQNAHFTSVQKMIGCDGEVVTDLGANTFQDVGGRLQGNFGNLFTSAAQLHYVLVIILISAEHLVYPPPLVD